MNHLNWTRRAAAAVLLGAGASAFAAECRLPNATEAAFYTSPVAMPGVVSPRDGTCFLPGQTVVAADGTRLTANVFLPAGAAQAQALGQKLPAVLYIASWASAEFFEYVGHQHRMARAGYVAAAYTPRGFWGSEGQVAVAAPEDIRDVSAAIDWLARETPAFTQRIGVAGISYGAGIGLMAAAAEPRVGAVAALSGWADLVQALYANEVPNPTWIGVLTASGQLTGRLHPDVQRNADAVLNPDSTLATVAAVTQWAALRSPSSYIAALNRAAKPILISKNWQDHMFTPNSPMALFSQLTGPKKLLLQPGIHASAELGGAVFGSDNDVMDQTQRWMDRWIRGIDNGIDREPPVALQVKFSGQRETLSAWPAPELRASTWALQPRGAVRFDWSCFCTLGMTGGLARQASTMAALDRIDNALDTTASTGVLPIISVTGETLGAPIVNLQSSILRGQGLRYTGPALTQPMRIRGIPKLNLKVVPSQRRGMLVAYLYSVDPLGWGTLVTHGAKSLHNAVPGAPVDFAFDLVATAQDVPAGHRLELVLDTRDSLYGAPVQPFESFAMTLAFDGRRALTMTLPTR